MRRMRSRPKTSKYWPQDPKSCWCARIENLLLVVNSDSLMLSCFTAAQTFRKLALAVFQKVSTAISNQHSYIFKILIVVLAGFFYASPPRIDFPINTNETPYTGVLPRNSFFLLVSRAERSESLFPNLKQGGFDMARKGYKRQRNQPEIYEEVKKPVSLGLAPTAKGILRSFATAHKMSQSEFIERLMREIKSVTSRLNSSFYPQTLY